MVTFSRPLPPNPILSTLTLTLIHPNSNAQYTTHRFSLVYTYSISPSFTIFFGHLMILLMTD
jgi:hypothetical protein